MENKKLTLSEEVAEVFDAFVAYRQQSNELYDSQVGGVNKIVFGVAVVIWGLGSVLFLFAPDFFKGNVVLSGVTLALMVFALIVFIIDAFLTFGSFKGFVTDTTLDLLKGFSEVGKTEVEFLQSLNGYSEEALNYVKLRFDNSISTLNTLVAILVGAFEKIGLFPALLALVIAFIKLPQTGAISIYTLVAFILVGIYFICFKFLHTKVFFNRYKFLLDFHLEHMRKEESTK